MLFSVANLHKPTSGRSTPIVVFLVDEGSARKQTCPSPPLHTSVDKCGGLPNERQSASNVRRTAAMAIEPRLTNAA